MKTLVCVWFLIISVYAWGQSPIVSSGNSYDGFETLREYVQRKNKTFTKPQSVLAVYGGWGTCEWEGGPLGSDVFRRTLIFLKQQASRGIYYRVLATCFTKFSSNPLFFSSAYPDQIYQADFEYIKELLEYETKLTARREVAIAGHSHGGFLALRTAVALPESVKVSALMTLDPISQTYCTPKKLMSSYLRSAWNLDPHPGCTRAPADFSTSALESIRERTSWWHNFYQADALFLHSSSIPGATNHFLSFEIGGIFDIFSPHMQIDSDERAWRLFDEFLAAR